MWHGAASQGEISYACFVVPSCGNIFRLKLHPNIRCCLVVFVLYQRVYDMAGCMSGYGGARMKVSLNKKRLPVSTFKEYISMYDGMEQPVIFEKISNRWEVMQYFT